MILLTINDMSECLDFIMWGNIEFAMQLELYNAYQVRKAIAPAATGALAHSFTILDMSNLSQLQSMASGETLYIVGHGISDFSGIAIQRGTKPNWDVYTWSDLGKKIGRYLPAKIEAIHLLACYGAHGLKELGRGLSSSGKAGVKLRGYYGPAINSSATGPTSVIIDNKPGWSGEQDLLIGKYIPQSKLDSWRSSHSSAKAVDIAIEAAEVAWDFYYQYGVKFESKGFFYAPSKRESKIYEQTS
ncbi:hypothetical protein [Methylomonas koyamae]|uniref:hypothetical protein n=1 Tax=Methylomonas koyamae TaxID=702114 RepID=UPI0011265E7D|nr:hypothetical protein [Methylomonas koyamae]TPQ26925.1 hypothetical protein C2U68_09555 [Methylomonas koyamae]